MIHTSIIIYFGDNPVGYDLIQKDDTYYFKPFLKDEQSFFPDIDAKISEEKILVSLDDENIKEQVCKLIRMTTLLKFGGTLSAAC